MDDPRRRKLLYRANHRGFKEADLILGKFAEQHLAGMSDRELDAFEQILEIADRDLYDWITDQAPMPAGGDEIMMQRIKDFRPGQGDDA